MRFMPTKNEDGVVSERTIDQLKIGVKEAVVVGVFLVSHAVSWGMVVTGNSERDLKITALADRATKQEEVITRLMAEVIKVGRDTEWIRSYLNENKNPTPR